LFFLHTFLMIWIWFNFWCGACAFVSLGVDSLVIFVFVLELFRFFFFHSNFLAGPEDFQRELVHKWGTYNNSYNSCNSYRTLPLRSGKRWFERLSRFYFHHFVSLFS